jgi:ankyrin repeat protein
MWAAFFGQYSIAETLLQLGADFKVTNKDGDTALSLAGKQGYRTIVNLLRQYGATQ